uniref:Uncharacterized protein n=1 Tax=Glossina pallidipes TaxID=7398 RepID=A0A1A9ZQK3_GLOPL
MTISQPTQILNLLLIFCIVLISFFDLILKIRSFCKVLIRIKFDNVSVSQDICVVLDVCTASIGRTWIRLLDINFNDLDQIDSNTAATYSTTNTRQIEELLIEFPFAFEHKIGIVDHILPEIPKTEAYFDEIVVHGESLAECKANFG